MPEVAYENGDKYEGDLVNNKRTGQGTYIDSEGRTFTGTWQNDDFVKGKYKGPEGEYDGEWKDHIKEGKGTFDWQNGEKYTGDWKDDTMNGHGVYNFANGKVYEGEWLDGLRNGFGELKMPTGGHYVGSWANDKCNGKGRFTDKLGVYEGDWWDNLKHGRGVFKYPTGHVFDGEWRYDKKVMGFLWNPDSKTVNKVKYDDKGKQTESEPCDPSEAVNAMATPPQIEEEQGGDFGASSPRGGGPGIQAGGGTGSASDPNAPAGEDGFNLKGRGSALGGGAGSGSASDPNAPAGEDGFSLQGRGGAGGHPAGSAKGGGAGTGSASDPNAPASEGGFDLPGRGGAGGSGAHHSAHGAHGATGGASDPNAPAGEDGLGAFGKGKRQPGTAQGFGGTSEDSRRPLRHVPDSGRMPTFDLRYSSLPKDKPGPTVHEISADVAHRQLLDRGVDPARKKEEDKKVWEYFSVPYAELKVPSRKWNRPDIDAIHRERYLSDAEFVTVFKCTKDEFNKMPPWKQNSKKKTVKLY